MIAAGLWHISRGIDEASLSYSPASLMIFADRQSRRIKPGSLRDPMSYLNAALLYRVRVDGGAGMCACAQRIIA